MFSTFETELGTMALATYRREVVGLTFGHRGASAARKSLVQFHSDDDSMLRNAQQDDSPATVSFHNKVVNKLIEFAAGEEVDLEGIAVNTSRMTVFQKQVHEACRAIPWGETLSYGQLATVVGHPGAARAVGTVMSKNRYPLIVPCHRVLGSQGKLGGYSAPEGLSMKRRLLEMEQSSLFAAAQ
jgi:methylated-DNA-[protein]-cysteine S-methyltransferase